MSKRVLFIGDAHVGSNVGLSPVEMMNEDGLEIHQNKVQEWILNKYHRMIDDVGIVDLLVVNGDLVEGINYQGEGVGNWTNDMDIQVETSANLLSEIKFRKCVGCSGTRYHSGDNPKNDRRVIEKTGGKWMKEISTEINGIRIHASHKASVYKNKQSKPSAVAGEMVAAEINSMEFGKYHIIARSHTHTYAAVDMGTSIGFLLPCWKGRDDYAIYSASPLTFNPSIGYVVVEIDNNGSFSWYRDVEKLKGNNSIKTLKLGEVPTRSEVYKSQVRGHDY
jgi:hypothetical protein